MVSIKDEFKNYIKNDYVSRTKNGNLGGQSPDKYISSLNTLNSKISVIDSDKNFFSYDFEDYTALIEKIRNAPDFDTVNESEHRTLKSALKAFEQFVNYQKLSEDAYLSIKISNPNSEEVVNKIINKASEIEINQLNQHKDSIKKDQLVFMVPFGDKVSWEKGLAGIGKISELPYDVDGKEFKIKVDMFCSFKTISRAEFIPYPGTYDAADIGPSTKGSQNQALKQITLDQAVSIIRAILELRPETKKDIFDNVDKKIIDLALGPQLILTETISPYNKATDTFNNNNVIYYGIPGSGKSYKIKKELENKRIDPSFIFRTTFYLDYSNSDFVGQILPYVEGGKAEYKYVPGPFTKALRKALENKNKEVYLIIEELNRGNAAAIFGDIFQLLDRKNGISEYPISNHFIEEYFEQEDISDLITEGQIVIPSNMFIYATMNTSDQNVFPLDTAFKRRWKLERVVPEWDKCSYADSKIPNTSLTWKEFATTINTQMCAESKDGLILEDKQLGPWFVGEEIFTTDDKEEAINAFTDKVVDYIWSDVAKFDRKSWFDPSITDFNKIREEVAQYVNETYDDKKKDFKIISISSYLKSENE